MTYESLLSMGNGKKDQRITAPLVTRPLAQLPLPITPLPLPLHATLEIFLFCMGTSLVYVNSIRDLVSLAMLFTPSCNAVSTRLHRHPPNPRHICDTQSLLPFIDPLSHQNAHTSRSWNYIHPYISLFIEAIGYCAV